MLKYYRTFEDSFEFKYSLDMVRYNYSLFSSSYNSFIKLLKYYELCVPNCISTYYPNRKTVGYADLWTLEFTNQEGDKGVFTIGRQLNFLTENKHSGFCEFNPNKVMCFPEFQKFFDDFRQFCSSFELVRYDCAIDIPISRNHIKMIRSGRSNYEYQYHETKDKISALNDGFTIKSSVTEYQGRRNHNKFCKLYDKRAESKLDYDLSRVEFTFDRDELKFENLPQFYVYDTRIFKDFDFKKLSQNELVFVDLLRNSEDKNLYLTNLTYRFRKKIEPYLNDFSFVPSSETIKSVRDTALYFEI